MPPCSKKHLNNYDNPSPDTILNWALMTSSPFLFKHDLKSKVKGKVYLVTVFFFLNYPLEHEGTEKTQGEKPPAILNTHSKLYVFWIAGGGCRGEEKQKIAVVKKESAILPKSQKEK